jgi:hypothetical protein
MWLPVVLRAQTNYTAISNLNQPIGSGGNSEVSGNQICAMSFTTGNELTSLSAVSVSIYGSNPGHPPLGGSLGAFSVALYDDASGSPGNSLMFLSGNNYPTNAGIYTYTNTSALLLMTNTTYWIVGSSSNSTGGAQYKWKLTSNATLDSDSIWTLGECGEDSNGRGWAVISGYYLEFSVTVTTNQPATPLISSTPTASAIIYGQTLASSTLSGGAATNSAGAAVDGSFAFTTPSTIPGAGTSSEPVTFTPTDFVDYYAITTTVPVTATINLGATPLISSAPTASIISYGQTLASSTLSGGAATNIQGVPVDGSFAFTTPSTVPCIGTASESVTFTPTDTVDYITATISVPVTVIPFTCSTNDSTNDDVITLTITGYTGPGGAVTIPDSINGLPVIGIGAESFYRSSLTSVTISTNVTSIGVNAFAGCRSLTNVTIPDSVTSVGEGAFNVCSSLASVTIPNSLTTIEPGVFGECTALASVAIPDRVTSVGENAFDDCSSLASVTIGSGVTNIGIQAFSGFNKLTSITVDPNNPAFCSVAGVLFDKGMTTLIQFPGGWVGNYTVPNGISSIGYESFADCGNLTGVIIPNTVTNIGAYAFIYCTSLTSITIPIGVNTLQEWTFAYDASLTNVTISGAVASLGSQVSNDLKQSGGTGIQNAVASLGNNVFSECTGLTSIYFSGNAPSVDGTDFGSDNSATAYYLPGTTGWADFTATTGVPAVLWNPQAQTGDGSFGVRSNKFGFDIAGGSNLMVVVMACTNLASPVWSPVSTNTLNTFIGTNGMSYFSDPQWTNYPRRYYGFSWP